jgi:lipoprotein NlpD
MNFLVSLRVASLVSSFSVLAGCASSIPAPVVDRSQQPSGTSSAKASDVVKGGVTAEAVARKGHYIVKPGDTLFRIALDHGQAYRDLAAWNSLVDPNRLEVGQELRVSAPDTDVGPAVAEAKPIGMNNAVEQRSLDGNTSSVKAQPKGGRESYSDEALARLSAAADHGMARVELPPDVRSDVKVAVPPLKNEDDVVWAWPASGKIAGQFIEGGSKGLDILGKKGDPVQAASDGKVVYSGSGLRGYGQLLIIKHNNVFLTAYAHNSKILVKEGQSVTRGQKIAEMGDTEADQVKLHFEVRRQGKPVDPLKHLPPR